MRRYNVMLQWDLSDTPLIRQDMPGEIPTESETLALIVGMLMLEGITYEALRHRELILDDENLGRMFEIFEYRLPELAREFGDGECLRERLAELTGIRMTRSDAATPGERSVIK